MTGTDIICLHTNQSRSYLKHLVLRYKHIVTLPFKFAASHAKRIYLYKNLRTKVQKRCANIYFNQQCLKQVVTPKYAQMKVPYTSPASITFFLVRLYNS